MFHSHTRGLFAGTHTRAFFYCNAQFALLARLGTRVQGTKGRQGIQAQVLAFFGTAG